MLSEYRLSEMRRLHDITLFDTCQRMVYTAGADTGYGYGIATYPAGATLDCLVIPLNQEEVMSSAEVRMGDVRIRLSRSATLTHRDRLKVTHLHDDALATAQTYEIISGPQVDHTGTEVIGRLVP